MFEMIGLLFGLTFLCVLAVLAGGVSAGLAYLLFWGAHRPKRLIIFAGLIPISALSYVVFCAICMEMFIPNQPDLFFGDFAEPLPNGYILTGLGKMPEYSYFESSPQGMHQPLLLGGVRRLEQDGQTVYGAYGHLDNQPYDGENKDRGYFIFDTRTGGVRNFTTIGELNAAAGHPVHLVESQYFQSQDPGRTVLRRVENVVFSFPPASCSLLCLFLLLRERQRRRA
jgi:hypothetical protein